MKTRPDRKKLMSFSESVATNLLESVVKTHATNWLFPCVITQRNYFIPKYFLLANTIKSLTGNIELKSILNKFSHCSDYSKKKSHHFVF